MIIIVVLFNMVYIVVCFFTKNFKRIFATAIGFVAGISIFMFSSIFYELIDQIRLYILHDYKQVPHKIVDVNMTIYEWGSGGYGTIDTFYYLVTTNSDTKITADEIKSKILNSNYSDLYDKEIYNNCNLSLKKLRYRTYVLRIAC